MSKRIKKPLVATVGDLICVINKPTIMGSYQGIEPLIEAIMQNHEKFPNCDEPFIYNLEVKKVLKFDKGIYEVKGMPHECQKYQDDDIDHKGHLIFKLNQDVYDRALIKNPILFKYGERIINPYLKIPDKNILENKEEEIDEAYYGLSSYSHMLARKKWDPVKCQQLKSIPWLEVVKITTSIDFNIKYQKFLLNLTHSYTATYSNHDVEISFCFESAKGVDRYDSFNDIWNNLCISPNQVT